MTIYSTRYRGMKFKVVKRCQEDLSSVHGLLKSFLPFARKRMGFNKPPTIMFQSDQGNAQKLLGKTAHYEPATGHITVYVTGRHPKDVLRSLSHELVHHGQNCRGEFGHTPDTAPGYAQTDSHMRKMEEEAYSVGNLCFRDWEDSVKSGKIRIPMSLKESLIREQKEYITVDGDTLSGIAQKQYGDSHMWPIIYLANESQIGGDPDLISPGMVFVIPDASEFSKLSQDKINSIYALSSFYTKSGSDMAPTGGSVGGSALNVDESDILFPVASQYRQRGLTGNYGPRGPIKKLAKHGGRYAKRHMHLGVDVPLEVGTPIIAPASGRITLARTGSKSAGNYLELLHDTGQGFRLYKFMHLEKFMVKRGQDVEKGQTIALSGNTGRSTGPHLHYEIKVDVKPNGRGGKHVDPMSIYGTKKIDLAEWKNEELNKLLLEKFNLGVRK